jgi:zinc transporter ZupT
MLFIAIIAHKGSESFALAMTLLRHTLPIRRILVLIILFSFMTPIGITLGTTIQQLSVARSGELAAALFNAFAAGTFLYISTLHHIHFHQRTQCTPGLLELASLIIGVATMAVIAVWT